MMNLLSLFMFRIIIPPAKIEVKDKGGQIVENTSHHWIGHRFTLNPDAGGRKIFCHFKYDDS